MKRALHRGASVSGKLRPILAGCLALALSSGAAASTAAEKYVILDREGGPAGTIEVVPRADGYAISWDFKNNGRGTETREQLSLDGQGLPSSWRIETKTDLGGGDGNASPGNGITTFRAAGGKSEWSIDGKAGSADGGTTLFAPSSASPWAQGIYARALLKQPDAKLPTAPSGSLRLTKLREELLGGVSATAYQITGPDEQSETVHLDRQGRLIAIGDGRVVPAGREDIARELREAALTRKREAHMEQQRKLLHTFDNPVRVRSVRIFDPRSGKLGSPSSVVFYRDRIVEIEPVARPDQPGETVIDGEGGTLIPGFNDTHYHAGLAGPEGSWLSLAAGVTTARDMGSSPAFMQPYLDDVAAGRLPGPRIVPSGLIEGDGSFSLQSSGKVVANEAEAVDAVRWYAERGYWQIKIYNSVNPAWVPAIAREAHRLGLRVAGHVPAFTTADAMIEAGYDEVTHANQLMLGWVLKPGEDTRTPLRLTAMSRFASLDLNSAPVQKTLARMKAGNIAFEPTLAIMRRLVTNRTGEVEPADRWWFSHLPQPFKPGDMITVLPGFTIMPINTPADDAAYKGAAAKMIELVRMMNARGIQTFLGSDDNNGFIYQRELELFVEAGMTPAQALRRATIESAAHLGHADDWGSIERGKSADFLLVPGDPTTDIKAVHAVRMTVAQGRVYFPAEIYQALGVKPFASPPVLRQRAP